MKELRRAAVALKAFFLQGDNPEDHGDDPEKSRAERR
jgi:hypothetical protein